MAQGQTGQSGRGFAGMDRKSPSQTGSGSPLRGRYSTLNWLAGLMLLVALVSWGVATLRDQQAEPRHAEVRSRP